MFPQRSRLAQEGSKPEEDKRCYTKRGFKAGMYRKGSEGLNHTILHRERGREEGRERGSESAVCV